MKPNHKVKVLSTTAIIDDIVAKVGGDRIDHIALIEGAIDPHSYELVKGDDEKLAYAQIVFSNGLGLEHGASLRYQLEHHPKAVALGDQIRMKKPDAILSDRGQIDPHIWLDVALWSETVDPIVEALSDIDPEGAPYYASQAQLVKENLSHLDQSIHEKLHQISQDKRYLVTSHDAFNYFTRRYLTEQDESWPNGSWKERFCAPEGIAPDGQLSAHDIQTVMTHLIHHQIRVIFPESNVSRDSLKKILSVCLEKGMKVTLAPDVLYSDSFGSSSDTYEQMMQHNADVLSKAWNEYP
jgi:manganese/zinc/iron transport system substrate-binding protein